VRNEAKTPDLTSYVPAGGRYEIAASARGAAILRYFSEKSTKLSQSARGWLHFETAFYARQNVLDTSLDRCYILNAT